MRILSRQELGVFNDAFVCIMRVANASTTDQTEIKVGGERLPMSYFELINEIGGLQKLDHHFCPMHKEETLKWLIKRCFRDRQQPIDFVFDGTVSIEKHNYNIVEHTFA